MSATPHTDSAIVEYHEDGSYTVTTVETHQPLTKADQAKGWAALGALMVIAVAPATFPYVLDKMDERRERKAAKKAAKLEVVKTDD